ncbi:MAG: GNAT family N-acetyltransferase [Candidatus Dadabacteria bacterium]|nr:MAG: GNAT family N-acetyltransferase [Candidatus Dadabacteria bacterium]
MGEQRQQSEPQATAAADLVVEVEGSHLAEAAHILATALRHDPGLQAVARASGRRRDARVTATMQALLDIHLAHGQPVWGIYREGRLVAVALVERPGHALRLRPTCTAFVRLALATNPLHALRVARVLAASRRPRPRAAHHNLAALAVAPIAQGIGLGTRLLEELHRSCREHPSSTGVALVTTNPANVPYFERFAYTVASITSAAGAELWAMWRPAQPSGE